VIIVGVLDLTSHERLRRGLVEANQRLEEFFRVASHDLRSPLRGIANLHNVAGYMVKSQLGRRMEKLGTLLAAYTAVSIMPPSRAAVR